MAQRTHYLSRYGGKSGIVGLDGTRVHVLHPDDPTKVLEMPHKTEAEAEATFKKVIGTYFSARHGWKVWRQIDEIDVTTWIRLPPPPPSEAEQAAARAAQHVRERGWDVAGETMILSLSRNRSAADLDMALEHAATVSALHVLVSEDDGGEDDVPTARYRLFERLVAGAAPRVTTLTLDSPWTRNDLSKVSLHGVERVLGSRSLVHFGALGVFEWPDLALPGLAHVRLHGPKLAPAELARIRKSADLRTVQLTLPMKSGPLHYKAIAAFPLGQLDELAVEWVTDVGALLDALLDAGRRGLPARVHVQGDLRPLRTLRAAIARWHRDAPTTPLTFGELLAGTVDEATRDAIAEATITSRLSPFAGEAQDPALQRMWAPLR